MVELARYRYGAVEGLQRLRTRGWRTGIVIDGALDERLATIRRVGLDTLVDGWCVSGELTIGKPEPEILLLAAQHCGHLSGEPAWTVGTDLTLDIAGGRAAGMRTVYIQPRHAAGSFIGPPPDLVVDSITAAVDALLASSPT